MALDEETAAALNRLSEIRAAATQTHDALTETAHTQESRRRVLSATVGLAGDLQNLTFNGVGYRALAPSELASLIVETVNEAQDGARQKASRVIEEVFPEAASDFDVFNAASNLEELVAGFCRIAEYEFSDEEIATLQKSWKGEK